MNIITLYCNPHRMPSVDDIVPHLAKIVEPYSEAIDPFTSPRYRVSLRHENGSWELAWGDEYDYVPGRSQVLRVGLCGYRLTETARYLIDGLRY